jgi:hypothetical protein
MRTNRLAVAFISACASLSVAGCFIHHKEVKEVPGPAVVVPAPAAASSTTTTTTTSDNGAVERHSTTTYNAP